MPRKRTRYDVTVTQFVAAWESAKSIAEVSAILNMPVNIVRQRFSGYKNKGVKLKEFPRPVSKQKINVADLNSLIQQIREGKVPVTELLPTAEKDVETPVEPPRERMQKKPMSSSDVRKVISSILAE